MDKHPTDKYETPQIVDHGDLTELTAATTTTGNYDANYQVGKPIVLPNASTPAGP